MRRFGIDLERSTAFLNRSCSDEPPECRAFCRRKRGSQGAHRGRVGRAARESSKGAAVPGAPDSASSRRPGTLPALLQMLRAHFGVCVHIFSAFLGDMKGKEVGSVKFWNLANTPLEEPGVAGGWAELQDQSLRFKYHEQAFPPTPLPPQHSRTPHLSTHRA